MDKRYGIYGFAVIVGGAIAIWAGLSPFFLLLVVACPLMMFFMMRGGMGGMGGMHGGTDDSSSSEEAKDSEREVSARLHGDQDRDHH